MLEQRWHSTANRRHVNGPLVPMKENDPWWDRPSRFFGMTLLQWGVTAGFLLILGATLNLLAWIGERS